MKKKIMGILVCMLLIATVLPVSVSTDGGLDQKRNVATLCPDVVDLPPIPKIPAFPPITSNGNAHHVDKDIGSNNYTNEQAQNPATPWATIRHGVNQLSAGDMLIVHEAESAYKVNTAGEHDIMVSGTETNWITIKGANGERPVISTDYTSSCQSNCPRGFRFRSTARYIYVTNFDMEGFIYIGIRFDPGSEHIVIDDIDMDSIDAVGVEIGDYSNTTGAKHLYLRDITVTNSGYMDDEKRGAFVIFERSEDIVFERCIAIDSQSSGFRVYGWKGSNPPPLPYDPEDSIRDLYLIGCESHSGGSTQANFVKVYNLVVKDCIFADGVDHGEFTGLKFWGKELWLINSVLDNNYVGLELLPCYGDADIYVLHDTFIDNKWSSIRKKCYRYIESGPGYFYDAANMYLYNNIFTVTSNIYHSDPYCCFATEHTNGNIVESNNNFFFGQDNKPLFGFYQWVSEPWNTLLLKAFYMSDVNDAGTGDWQTDTTHGPLNSDVNSISRYPLLDPGFTNMAGDDYSLKEGNLAIDAGVDIGITHDIIGIERPQGSAPDIGAYEYSSGSIWTEITKPEQGHLYIFDQEIMPTIFGNTIIVGKITIKADAMNNQSGMNKVEFYVDDVLKNTDNYPPYQWLWDEFAFGNHELKVIAYDIKENKATENIDVLIFNI